MSKWFYGVVAGVLMMNAGISAASSSEWQEKYRNQAILRIESLLKNGGNLNTPDRDGRTPLMSAVNHNLVDLARGLLDRGADVNIGRGNETPLDSAASMGKIDMVKLLWERGAGRDEKSASNALAGAVSGEHLETARFLVGQGVKLYPNSMALQRPVEHNNIEMVKLIAESQEINQNEYFNSDTLLCMAAREGHVDMAKLLLDYGADINRGPSQLTPLHMAVMRGHFDMVTFLVQNGADEEAKNFEGKTALDLAREGNHHDVVAYLEGGGKATKAAY